MAVERMAEAGRHGTIVVAETSKPCLKVGERANWEYYGLLKPLSLSVRTPLILQGLTSYSFPNSIPTGHQTFNISAYGGHSLSNHHCSYMLRTDI